MNPGMGNRVTRVTPNHIHLMKLVDQSLTILQSNNYCKACKRSPFLPKIGTDVETLEILRSLQYSDILVNVKNIAPCADEPWYLGLLSNKPVPTPIVPLIPGEAFVWAEPPAEAPQCTGWTIFLLRLFIILVLFSSRKKLMELPVRANLRHIGRFWRIDLTFSLGSLADFLLLIFVSPFIIVFVRTALFLVTHTFYRRGFWLFPNLLSDSTFFGPFCPLYSWDANPKEGLGLRWRRFRNSILADFGMLKRRRRGRKR